MSVPPTPAEIALARLEVKVDMALRRLDSHSAQLESLKARRLPVGILTVAFAGIGALGSVAGFVVHR